MSGWYYISGDDWERQGPLTWEELQELAASGKLRKDNTVWQPGESGQLLASEVPGLFSATKPAPASSPEEPPPFPPGFRGKTTSAPGRSQDPEEPPPFPPNSPKTERAAAVAPDSAHEQAGRLQPAALRPAPLGPEGQTLTWKPIIIVSSLIAALAVIVVLTVTFVGESTYLGKPHSHWKAQARDKSPEFRILAAVALGHLGDTTTLIELLHDKESRVQAAAAVGLEQVGAPAIPTLAELIRNDKDRVVRALTLTILVKIGPPAIPALSKLAQEGDADLQVTAITVLGQIGAPSVPYLVMVLRNAKTKPIVIAIANRLGDIGPAAKEAIPVLAERFKKEAHTFDNDILDGLQRAILKIDPEYTGDYDFKWHLHRNDPSMPKKLKK